LSSDSFEVTRPYLTLPPGLSLFRGVVSKGVVEATGEARPVPLEGQEFLRFRGAATQEDVAALADEYGTLGLDWAADPFEGDPYNKRPLFAQALTRSADFAREPVEDWLRQAGLLDFAVGLVGMVGNAGARRSLAARAKALTLSPGPPVTVQSLLHRQLEVSDNATFPVRSILAGAARAGLRCSGVIEQPEPNGERRRYLDFSSLWLSKDEQGRLLIPAHLSLWLSETGVLRLLKKLLDPWLGQVWAAVIVQGDVLRPAISPPGTLLARLWLQLANAALSKVKPRVCAWERCPGPPKRPQVFFWRWGTMRGPKHGDAIYCHPLCQHAAAVARSREQSRQYREARRRGKS
jgi:hypothetical protein